jgi:hypothetical protein
LARMLFLPKFRHIPNASASPSPCNTILFSIFLVWIHVTHPIAYQILSPAALTPHKMSSSWMSFLDFHIAHSPDHSQCGPRLEVLTHWDGYNNPTHDSWEPFANLKHVEALHDFARSKSALARLFHHPTYLQHHSQYPTRFPISIPLKPQHLPPSLGGVGMLGLHQDLTSTNYTTLFQPLELSI